MLGDIGHHLIRRAATDGFGFPEDQSPPSHPITVPLWAWPLGFLDLILIFIPLIIFSDYTLQLLYPVFTIIEDENPPAYEPLSLDETALSNPGTNILSSHNNQDDETPGLHRQPTVTSSLRSINRLLYANGGLRANIRGLSIASVQIISTTLLRGIFTYSLGLAFAPLASLLTSLSLIQLATAWVHIVITPASHLRFWERLPPFRRTFDATWKPVIVYWFAVEFARWLPTAVGRLVGIELPSAGDVAASPDNHFVTVAWQAPIIFIVSVLTWMFIVLPARVVLIRVQASLLSPEQDTIIPFDRTFGGMVESQIVDGRGYATMLDAWATYSRDGWKRLVKLYVKVTALGVGLHLVHGLLIIVPFGILIGFSSRS